MNDHDEINHETSPERANHHLLAMVGYVQIGKDHCSDAQRQQFAMEILESHLNRLKITLVTEQIIILQTIVEATIPKLTKMMPLYFW